MAAVYYARGDRSAC